MIDNNDVAPTEQEGSNAAETDSNWREHMLKALRAGLITTMITFNDTKYLVTLQPYEHDDQVPQKALCHVCGQIALRRPGETRWYHEDASYGHHAAEVQGWTPTDPNKAWQHAHCVCGANLTWFVGEQKWKHTKGKAEGHIATPTTIPPTAAATPVQKPLVIGQTTVCGLCGQQLRYTGAVWEHTYGQPKHRALPT